MHESQQAFVYSYCYSTCITRVYSIQLCNFEFNDIYIAIAYVIIIMYYFTDFCNMYIILQGIAMTWLLVAFHLQFT